MAYIYPYFLKHKYSASAYFVSQAKKTKKKIKINKVESNKESSSEKESIKTKWEGTWNLQAKKNPFYEVKERKKEIDR